MVLTSQLRMGLAEKNIFFLLASNTGSCKNKEEMISDCTAGGAVAVRAMKGACINALNPPIALNASLKAVPLYINKSHVIVYQ